MQDIFRERRLREELREFIRQESSNRVQFTKYTLSSGDGSKDAVHGHRVEGSGEVDYDYPAQRLQHFGFRSRPPAGVWAIRVNVGRSANSVIVAEDSNRYGPSMLNDGEVVLYNKVNGTQILLDQNGKITIADKGGASIVLDGTGAVSVAAAAGKDTVLNGGTLKVARATDALNVGTLAGTVLVAGAPVAVQFTYTPGTTGTPTPQPVSPTASLTGIINAGAGAPHLKG